MSIKLYILTLAAVASTSSFANIAPDPFIKQWKYFDGVNTFVLNIAPSNAPDQSYHIDYTFPGGQSSTDMCKITSDTSFNCLTGETVKLVSRDNTYTFYDPDHMPSNDPLLGNWAMKMHSDEAIYQITILKGNNSNEYNVLTSYSDNRGNHCYYSDPSIYQVTKNPDGSEILSYNQYYDHYSFKYNPQTQQITNPKPGELFKAGQCVSLYDDERNILFTKQ
jgi:hypothetical protein